MGWFDFTVDVTPIKLDDHHTRHEKGGADEMSLAGLIVASEDISFTLNEYTSAQTLTADNYLVIVNAISGNITITLPASASHTNRIYTIKKIDSSSHTVTIDANSLETIDGETTIELKLQYAYITIVCDGDEWFIIGGEYVKMEDKLDTLITKQGDTNDLLERIRQETTKGTLHLASATEENITDEDTN